jgi:FkbM family methyltransferase
VNKEEIRREVIGDDCYKLKDVIWTRPPRYILDIGSNVGFFTEHAANNFPAAKIFAFEPVKKNYEESLSVREKHKNVVIENKAVIGFDEVKYLALNLNNIGGHKTIYAGSASYMSESRFDVAKKAKDPNRSISEFDAGQITFLEVLNSNNIDYVDFLKIDCEGCEYQVLQHIFELSLEKRILNLAMEIHHGGTSNKIDYDNLVSNLRSKFDHMKFVKSNIIVCKNDNLIKKEN